MQVNLHDAKTHLFRYVDRALAGEEVVIARAGKPLVRLIPVMEEQPPRRLGFLAGTARFDADLKRDFEDEINAMFDLGPEAAIEPGSTACCWTSSFWSASATRRSDLAVPWRPNWWIGGT